jgi:RNA polymerase sigma factor (sigma-70 family)
MRLFQVVCASLFTTTATGFVQPSIPQHHQMAVTTSLTSTSSSSSSSSSSTVSTKVPRCLRTLAFSTNPSISGGGGVGVGVGGTMAKTRSGGDNSNTKKFPILTPEEEKTLLDRAVVYRRLSELERDLAMQHPTKQLPLLSIRARLAGYDDELDAYEDAKYEGQKAREQLVTRNMGLVHYCVTSIIGRDMEGGTNNNNNNKNVRRTTYSRMPLNFLSREDLVQEGAIGLARAVDKWNPEIGGRFSTYAVYWVRAAILRCIAERDDMLRVPGHVTQAVQKINKAAQRLGWELDTSGMISLGVGNPTIANPRNSVSWKEAETAKKLALEAGLSDRTYQEAMKVRSRRYSGGYVPFEQWMQKGKNMERDVVVASGSGGLDESTDGTSMSTDDNTEELRSVLSKFLRPKEMEALSWRYGLLKDDPVVDNESAIERANRQFFEMEDQLFGATPAATVAVTKSSVTNSVSEVRVVAASVSPADLLLSGPTKGRFGEAMTFTEVGKKMEVSAEYTRKLCHQALDKLRMAAQDGRLEPALLL